MDKLNQIPILQNAISVEPLLEGWSEDEKYKVITRNHQVYVVRFSPISKFPQKRIEFDSVAEAHRHTPQIPQPIEVGEVEQYQVCYIIYQYIEGIELIKVIEHLSINQQYELGIQAGKILKQLHQVKGKAKDHPYDQMKQKIEKKKVLYQAENLEEPYHTLIVDYLDLHLPLLKTHSTTFCHGDYHIGNMLIGNDGLLYVIDFNRSNIEDPYQDFNRMITFGVKYSVPFVKGQIKGYFGSSEVDQSFFPIVLFYACMDIGFGLLWAKQFGIEEIKVHQELVMQIMHDFDYLKRYTPIWWEGE
jgi:aminoglycoside phosphotransferase (APT) family kinase protein